MRIADGVGGEAGVAAALDEAERRAGVEDVQLVRHAVELFIVHDPEAARLAIPPFCWRWDRPGHTSLSRAWWRRSPR